MLCQAGKLVYCDCIASLDRYNSPTFIMSASSSGGGIPLGMVITSGESENTLTESFCHLRSVFPQTAFFGRGHRCSSLTTVVLKKVLSKTFGQQQISSCAFSTTCSVVGGGYGIPRMALIMQINSQSFTSSEVLCTYGMNLNYKIDTTI